MHESSRPHPIVLILCFLSVVGLAGCGGGGGSSSSPSAPSAPSTPDTAAAANAIARQVATVTMRALRDAQSGRSQGSLTSKPLAAVGSYAYACPAGGQVTVGPLPAAIGEPQSSIGVTGVTQQWTSCAWDDGQRYTANGTLGLGGQFRPLGNQQSVTVATTGSYTVQPAGSMSVTGTVTGDSSFSGTVGAHTVSVGGAGTSVQPVTLAGKWAGAATFSAPAYGCSGRAYITLTLAGTTQLSGTVTLRIQSSGGSDPLCSRSFPNGPVGASSAFAVTGTASNGALNLTGGGLRITGEYGSSGSIGWMGGTFSGALQGFATSGTWQARK